MKILSHFLCGGLRLEVRCNAQRRAYILIKQLSKYQDKDNIVVDLDNVAEFLTEDYIHEKYLSKIKVEDTKLLQSCYKFLKHD